MYGCTRRSEMAAALICLIIYPFGISTISLILLARQVIVNSLFPSILLADLF